MHRKRILSKKQISNIFETRNLPKIDIDFLFELLEKEKIIKNTIDELRYEKNCIADAFQTECNKEELKNKSKIIQEQIDQELNNQQVIKEQLDNLLNKIPNELHKDVPSGKDASENKVIKQKGEIIFTKHHYDMDIFHDVVEHTGTRFVMLKGNAAKLERILANFMLDKLKTFGFEEYSVPVLFKKSLLEKTRHYPREAENMFSTESHWLIPTGELALLSTLTDKNLQSLPVKICTLSDCFRKEAGAAGKDTKGLIRVHQFKKVEMVVAANPENSRQILDEMVSYTCSILEDLEIPYRVVSLCSGDMGLGSVMTFDIEFPIGGLWREGSSVSDTGTYQSDFLNVKYNKESVHLLNGSAIAVGRTLASFLEVHYKAGKVKIPKALKPYINNEDWIRIESI